MKVKVYLIHSDSIYPPLGVLYLADALRKSSIDYCLLPVTTPYRELKKKFKDNFRTIIGMSVITSPDIKLFVRLSIKIKKNFPGIPIIWGGVHASLNTLQCIQEPYIDYVVKGFAEKIFPDMIKKLYFNECINGIVQGNEKYNLDDYSPAWGFDISKYIFPDQHSRHHLGDPRRIRNNIFYYFHTSRGCIYDCSFCSVSKNGKWQAHSFEWVKDQIKAIRMKSNIIDGIGFWDDMFWADTVRAYKIIEYLKGQDIGYLVEARADLLLKKDAQLFKKLSRTGCIQVFVGVESMDRKTLEHIGKRTHASDCYKLVHLAGIYKLPVRFSFIIGFPDESDRSVNKTLTFAEEIRTENYNCSISGPKLFTPYPGTLEYKRAVAKGFLPPNTLGWGKVNRMTRNYKKTFPWLKENLSKQTLKRINKLLNEKEV